MATMTPKPPTKVGTEAPTEYPWHHELTTIQATNLLEAGKPIYCVDTPGATHASLFASERHARLAAAFCGVHEVYDWLTREIVRPRS